MSVRSQVADGIAAAFTTARVLPYGKQLDNIEPNRPVVMVFRDTVAPHAESRAVLTHTLVVWVLVASTDEDDMDAALDSALGSLEYQEGVFWQTAERGVYADAFNGYRITVNVNTPNTFRQ